MAHELEKEELGGPSHTSAPGGLTLTVPSTSSPSQVTTPGAAQQDAPVAALRRYLDSIPQHPSPRREVGRGVTSFDLVYSLFPNIVFRSDIFTYI